MKVCVTLLFSTIVLECLVLQGVQGETHPGLLGDGFPGPYNLEQQAQVCMHFHALTSLGYFG